MSKLNEEDYRFALYRLLSYAWTARHMCETAEHKDKVLQLGIDNLILNVGNEEYEDLLAEEGVFSSKKGL